MYYWLVYPDPNLIEFITTRGRPIGYLPFVILSQKQAKSNTYTNGQEYFKKVQHTNFAMPIFEREKCKSLKIGIQGTS